MNRRTFLGTALAAATASPLLAALRRQRWEDAAEVLERATAGKQVESAVLHVAHRGESFTRHFGKAASDDAMFLLGSISKPINVTAVMTLFDQGKLRLDDRVKQFLPAFTGDGRDDVTIRHLLTHVSGLPDQLPNNNELRKQHAPLKTFAEHTIRTRLAFAPGTRYQYSSMGVLLAARIAELISGTDIRTLVDRTVFQPLGMKHSAQGLGRFQLEEMVSCQMEGAAPESGSGDPQAREWSWNSPYWRKLGAPWGGTHASAPDIARFLDEFLGARGKAVKPETARLMIRNHNPQGLTPRGLGFAVGKEAGSAGCSEQTFGHTGSTGTLCWADPASETICVVLTSLPRRALQPHPRDLAAERVAAARAEEPPASRQALLDQAHHCRRILEDSLVDFYLPACVDMAHGGYFEGLRDDRFAGTGEKFLVLQARHLWFFSTLMHEGLRKESARAAAKSGFEFLENHLRDRRHGGYYAKVTDAGEVKDPRKHVYLNSFALYGLVAYHQATGEERALAAARDLFRILEEKAHDQRNGGYGEFFTADWRPITDATEPGYVGAIGTKTYNTHLHVMEALTDLYRAWPDPLVRRRLAELLVINTGTVHHPDYNCNIDGWRPDWKMVEEPANLRASYGHDVECVWLTLDAGRALGLSPRLFRGWAEGLCSYSMKYGFDSRHGGFYYTGPLGRPAQDRRKEWWVQAEALVAMLEMHRLTGKRQYDDAFRQTFDFVVKHQVAGKGGWWATCAADGSPQGQTRTSPWQGAYHSGRALLRCAKLLEERAERRSP